MTTKLALALAVVASAAMAGGALAAGDSDAPKTASRPDSATTARRLPPHDLRRPSITGLAIIGQRLSASPGTWSQRPRSFTYSWKRCNHTGAHCKTIRHATARTYTLRPADVGTTLRVAVTAANAAGRSRPALSAHTQVVGHPGLPPHPIVQHLEYVLNDGTTHVYSIDESFREVEHFELPDTAGVRGVTVYPPTHLMFVSYGGDGGHNGNGSVLAYDLVQKRVIWSVNLSTGIDSGQVSADGKLLYMPIGEEASGGTWNILDTSNGNVVGKIETQSSGPHNTVLSADGKLLLLGGRKYNYLPIYNTQTGKIQTQIGPLVGSVRPLTVNGSATIAFTTATGFDGFQVGCITCTGSPVLFTESFGPLPSGFPFTTASHGIALTPDNRELAVLDAVHKTVQFWNVEHVDQNVAPTLVADVPVSGLQGGESDCAYDCARDGWVQDSVDGRYVFVGDSGSVIETATHTVVAHLESLENTRKSIEVDWSAGVPVATSGRTSVGG